MQSRRVTIDDFNMNIMDVVKVLFDEVDEPNKVMLQNKKRNEKY